MKRLAALAAAVLMVVGALALRQAREDDGGGADPREPVSRAVVCADELAEACRQAGLEVASADAGATADALIARDGRLEGRAWVTTRAWAELVLAERAFAGLDALVQLEGPPVASSPVLISLWEDAADSLGCAPVGWACLAERAGTELPDGNRLTVGSPHIESATGLVVAASQAADLLGSSDYSRNDFDLDDRFRRLGPALSERRLERPLSTMRSRGPGELTATGTTAADARNTSSTLGAIVSVGPAVPVRADVVVVVGDGEGLDDDERAALGQALEALGWQGPADGPDGLPDGAVLAALRSLWPDR